jgi:LPPG:FO 2-phospho-L-lactate transferase
MLASLGHESSAAGVARLYCDVATVFVLDATDAADVDRIAATGLRAVAMDTIMTDDAARARVAAAVLDVARSPDGGAAPPSQAAR